MKNFLLCACLLLIGSGVLAQEEKKPEEEKGFKKENLFISGNFGLGFGDYTVINISPQLGYRFSDFFAAGGGINAQYVSIKERNFNGNAIYKTSQGVAGLNIFGRIYPINQVMLQLQPEANYIFGKIRYYDTNQTYNLDAKIVPSLLAGAGAVLGGGSNRNTAFIISVFYDLLQDPNNPYGSRPFINFNYNIGL